MLTHTTLYGIKIHKQINYFVILYGFLRDHLINRGVMTLATNEIVLSRMLWSIVLWRSLECGTIFNCNYVMQARKLFFPSSHVHVFFSRTHPTINLKSTCAPRPFHALKCGKCNAEASFERGWFVIRMSSEITFPSLKFYPM